MGGSEVLVVRTGTANTASVMAGLRRCGASARITRDPEQVLAADRVVLPGVGALGAAMSRLNRDGLSGALAERVRAARPLMAVCLGFQILAEGSEESPEVPGLGFLNGRAERFPDTVRVPQLGWNRVQPDENCRLLAPGWAYFANSYRLTGPTDGWSCAYTDHGGLFVSAVERGSVLACQFHPELSGQWGLSLITRWLALPGGGGGGSC